MERIKNIVFDFDGTLLDTARQIMATIHATVTEMGLPPKTDEEYKSSIGLRLEDTPQFLWPGVEAAADYATIYRRVFNGLKDTIVVECFPGVRETLDYLRRNGYRMAVATSRSRSSLVEYLTSLGLDDYFEMLVGGGDVSLGKPAPDPVLMIMDACAWEARETMTVGDAPVDILMGRAAGTATCAVTYGNATEDELRGADPDYIIHDFEALIPILAGVHPDIVEYVEREILPRYDSFDKAHHRDHARMVIRQSLSLARPLPLLDTDMVYCIAAYHDTGLVNGREFHHIDSGRILASDEFLRSRFSPGDIETMRRAVEDHRASGKTAPRNDYGKVVADADRHIDARTIIRRTIQYGLANYPDLDRRGHFERTLSHLTAKYGPEGYLRVWLPWSDNAARLKALHALIADIDSLKRIFDDIFDRETV